MNHSLRTNLKVIFFIKSRAPDQCKSLIIWKVCVADNPGLQWAQHGRASRHLPSGGRTGLDGDPGPVWGPGAGQPRHRPRWHRVDGPVHGGVRDPRLQDWLHRYPLLQGRLGREHYQRQSLSFSTIDNSHSLRIFEQISSSVPMSLLSWLLLFKS